MWQEILQSGGGSRTEETIDIRVLPGQAGTSYPSYFGIENVNSRKSTIIIQTSGFADARGTATVIIDGVPIRNDLSANTGSVTLLDKSTWNSLSIEGNSNGVVTSAFKALISITDV